MAIRKEEFETANRRASAVLAKTPIAISARYDRRLGRIVVELSNELSVAFKPQHAEGLVRAKPEQLAKIEITPPGLGLYFPKLDVDLYLPSILMGILGSRRWIASQMGKAGGHARSRAKTAAARANGKLGGRPKKHPQPMSHNYI